MCPGLAEVLVRIIGLEMNVSDAVNSGRVYSDVETDTLSYGGNSSPFIITPQIFARNRDTAVPAEGNGDLQTLICVLVARPRRYLTLSNPVPWQNWMAAYLGYTLRMRTLFRGWPIMVNDTHTRRRRSLNLANICQHFPLIIYEHKRKPRNKHFYFSVTICKSLDHSVSHLC